MIVGTSGQIATNTARDHDLALIQGDRPSPFSLCNGLLSGALRHELARRTSEMNYKAELAVAVSDIRVDGQL
jgi:hypothetical protein